VKGWERLITFVVLTWLILFVGNIGNQVYANAWVDGTPYFHEDARFLAQTLGHNTGVMRAPLLVDVPPAYKMGDEREFYALNMRNGTQYLLKASCRGVSDKAYIFVENSRLVAADKITSLLASFDGIYDTITEQFGPPPDSIDGDPRIYLLLLDIIDTAQADGTRVMGYFSPVNQYQNIQLPRRANQRSNEVEMLYIDYTSLYLAPDIAENVAAHEFTVRRSRRSSHLVQWAFDPEESIWVDEGIAVYVEAMLGYEVTNRISAFEDEPETPLLNWSDSLANYGAAYIFFVYVSERFGGTPAIAAIVKNEAHDTMGIEQALAMRGESISFDRLFSDWVIANYLDEPKLNNGIYGYSTLNIHLKSSVVEAQYPITHKISRVKPWTAQYIEFKKGQDDSLSLTVYSNNGNNIVFQIIEFVFSKIGTEIYVSPIKLSNEGSGTALVQPETNQIILVVTSQPNQMAERWFLKRNDSNYNYSAETQATVASVAFTTRRKITTWGAIKRGD
jgi:hypothetical protein